MRFNSNPFASKKKRTSGKLAKNMGDIFEAYTQAACRREGINLEKIPTGCRYVGPKKIALVKTPFDFILAKNKQTAFIDCKTIESGNFSASMRDPNQIVSLLKMHNQNIPAGYIIWFRDKNLVIFATAEQLAKMTKGESIKHTDGIILGEHDNFSLQRVLSFFEGV